MKVMDAIKKRKSVRRYSHKASDWRKVMQCIEAATYAPSAGNLFSNKFILITDEKIIKELATYCEQDFVGHAKTLVVVVSDESKLVRSYGERGKRYSTQQAGAAIENFLLALTEKGIVTCWIGYFNEDKVKELLGIPEKLVVEALFPIGIETKIKTKNQKKTDLQNVIFFHKWGNKLMEPVKRVTNDSA